MRPQRFVFTIFFGGLALGSFFALGGCGGDESKTTGTQLQLSPAVKAELDDMKSAQKEARAERKADRAATKKGRK